MEEWEALAMEIIEESNSLTVEFAEMRSFTEDNHRLGFINCFKEPFILACKKFGMIGDERVEIFADETLDLWQFESGVETRKGKFYYTAKLSGLLSGFEQLAISFYDSNLFEINMKIEGKMGVVNVIICADPVYFYFFT